MKKKSKIFRLDYILIINNLDIDEELLANFNIYFSPETESFSYPIISDYKIPNQFGSYPLIYNTLVSIDRSFMNDIISFWDHFII